MFFYYFLFSRFIWKLFLLISYHYFKNGLKTLFFSGIFLQCYANLKRKAVLATLLWYICRREKKEHYIIVYELRCRQHTSLNGRKSFIFLWEREQDIRINVTMIFNAKKNPLHLYYFFPGKNVVKFSDFFFCHQQEKTISNFYMALIGKKFVKLKKHCICIFFSRKKCREIFRIFLPSTKKNNFKFPFGKKFVKLQKTSFFLWERLSRYLKM